MEATIKIDDRKTFQAFIDFLKSLKIEVIARDDNAVKGGFKSKKEFESLAGLWENRDVNIDKIREKAWPKRNW